MHSKDSINSINEVFEITSKVFSSLDDYIDTLPSNKKKRIYNNSQFIVGTRITDNSELLASAFSLYRDKEYDSNRSKQIIKMAEILVMCKSFFRENSHLPRRDYADKASNYPSQIRWLMMQFFIYTDIDFVQYFKSVFKLKYTFDNIVCIADSNSESDIEFSIENDYTNTIIFNLIDEVAEIYNNGYHLSRKDFANKVKNIDKNKVGLCMSLYDDKQPDYAKYINKHYYVFKRVFPIINLTNKY